MMAALALQRGAVQAVPEHADAAVPGDPAPSAHGSAVGRLIPMDGRPDAPPVPVPSGAAPPVSRALTTVPRQVGSPVPATGVRPERVEVHASPVIQRWEGEAIAEANKTLEAKKSNRSRYTNWEELKRYKRSREGGLGENGADAVEKAYSVKPPPLDRSWLLNDKKSELFSDEPMDIDGPKANVLEETTELTQPMRDRVQERRRTEHLAILNFLDGLAEKGEDTPAARYWNMKMPQFRVAMKKFLLGTADKQGHGATGFFFSRGRSTDRQRMVLPWIEPGTRAKPRGAKLSYREVDKKKMEPRGSSSHMVAGHVTRMEMSRFNSSAPRALKGLALISWYERGAKKKKAEGLDTHETVGERQEGFADPADLTTVFGTGMGITLAVSAKDEDLWALPLWNTKTGPTISDIRQGVQGNCWALAALATMVSRDPGLITGMVRDNGGTVTCRFYDEARRPEYVTVTKSATRASFWGVELRIANKGTSTWPILVLKAYASWLGSGRGQTLEAFDGGHSDTAFAHFAGAKPSREEVRDPDTTKAQIIKNLKAKNLVAAGSASDIPPKLPWYKREKARTDGKQANNAVIWHGIQKGHAYSVLRADDNAITLRNPWGQKKMLSLTGNGEFTLDWAEFQRSFDTVYYGETARQKALVTAGAPPGASR